MQKSIVLIFIAEYFQCCDYEAQINTLNADLGKYKEKLKSVISKFEKYKIGYDKYQVILEVIARHSQQDEPDPLSLADSTELVCVDLSTPNIMINKAKANRLKSISQLGSAARALVDMLFLEEQYVGKNYRILKSESPEKVNAILNYCLNKYSCTEAVLTKAITGKCTGR